MPKPWEPGGSDLDWVGVEPRELEFGVRASARSRLTIYFRPVGLAVWAGWLPGRWVERHMPPVLHARQDEPSRFTPWGRQFVDEMVGQLQVIGFVHNPGLDYVAPLSRGPRYMELAPMPGLDQPVRLFEGAVRALHPSPSGLGERIAREIESVPLTGVASLDDLRHEGARLARELPLEELVRRLRGMAPLRGQTEHVAYLDGEVPLGPSLEERIDRVFEEVMPHGTLSMASIDHYLRVGGYDGSVEDVSRVVDHMVEFGQLLVEPGSGYRLPLPEAPLEDRIEADYSQMELRTLAAMSPEEGHLTGVGVHYRELMAEEVARIHEEGPQAVSFEAVAGLAQEVAGEGPYPTLAHALEVMIRYNRFTAQEVVDHVMPLVPGVEREAVDAAVATVLHDARFVGRPEDGVIRWELREGRLVDAAVYNRELSAEEVAQIHAEGPPGNSMDTRILEAFRRRGPAAGSLLVSEIWEELVSLGWAHPDSGVSELVPILREMAGRGQLERSNEGWRLPQRPWVDGSGYATLGSELRDLVWGPGFAEFLTAAEIHSRLAGRRFWPPARVDEALESGFRAGVLERVVRGGVVVGYRPIITGVLRPTALERIVKGEPKL